MHLGHTKCPGYPTELVIALDMSSDVTPNAFNKIRSTAVSLLEDIEIAETNCLVGARVSVVAYNSYTSYLIRFSDYNQKRRLLEAVRGISLQRTRNRRNIGEAMRFVAENVFKHVRNGKLVRKVAVFLANGDSQDTSAIDSAMMKLKALDINLGVITFNDAPNILRAIQVRKRWMISLCTHARAHTTTGLVPCLCQQFIKTFFLFKKCMHHQFLQFFSPILRLTKQGVSRFLMMGKPDGLKSASSVLVN